MPKIPVRKLSGSRFQFNIGGETIHGRILTYDGKSFATWIFNGNLEIFEAKLDKVGDWKIGKHILNLPTAVLWEALERGSGPEA